MGDEVNERKRGYGMPVVSVIMPLYNKEPFVGQAIASVLSQSLSDIELIVVDNASTDGSRATAERCMQGDARARLLDETLPGAAAARNRALDVAAGEFLAFIDADDFVDHFLLEKAVAQARRTQADIVCFGHDHYFQEQDIYLYPIHPQAPESFAPGDLGGRLFFAGSPNACTKLFRRSFVEGRGERFDTEFITAEDMLFTFTLMMNASRIAVVDELLYHYRQEVPGSLTNKKVSRGVQSFDCLERLLAVAKETPSDEAFSEGVINLSLDQARYLMQIACNAQEFVDQYQAYHDNWMPRLDAISDRIYPEVRFLYDRYKAAATPMDLMYVNWQDALEVLRRLEGDHAVMLRDSGRREDELRGRIAEIEGSTTYRVGRTVMGLPCALKDRLRR